MPETTDLIARTPWPRTRESLAADLRQLGVAPGMTLLVHSSLSSLGWVVGGEATVVQALLDVLGPDGTLVMPAHSGANSDPAQWSRPPVPEAWWPVVREHTPAFDPHLTPTRQMGRIAELFRRWPGAVRSYHPQVSFAALGPQAKFITANHTLEDSLGEDSPLARIYNLDGWVLLLGVGHGNNTSLHLAEYRQPAPPKRVENSSAILEDGRRVWRTYADIDLNDEPFPDLGAVFDRTGHVRVAQVGSAEARLFRQRPAVDFAVAWLAARSV
jgi:aminoglycoside 3-N-acetyltransferase